MVGGTSDRRFPKMTGHLVGKTYNGTNRMPPSNFDDSPGG